MTGIRELDRYIDGIFSDITRTKETRTLKERIAEGAREQYETLLAQDMEEPQALSQVIADIGSAEDLRAEYPARNKALNILGYLFLALLIAGIVYAVYYTQNAAEWKRSYRVMPLWISSFFIRPGMYYCGAYLVLFFVQKFSPALRGLAAKRTGLRRTLLAIGALIPILYYLLLANIFLNLFPVPGGFTITFVQFISSASFRCILFMIPGFLLYAGIKK